MLCKLGFMSYNPRNTLIVITPLLALLAGCTVRPGHFAGGGQMCVSSNLETPLAECVADPLSRRAGFSFDLNAQDRNRNGILDEADSFKGHFDVQIPKSGFKIKANVLYGAVWGGEAPGAPVNGANELSANLASRVSSLTEKAAVKDFLRTHPSEGLAWMLGFYRQTGKNPDTCAEVDGDCHLVLAFAVDLDEVRGPSKGDFVALFPEFADSCVEEGLGGFVTNGNLSITSETVPAP